MTKYRKMDPLTIEIDYKKLAEALIVELAKVSEERVKELILEEIRREKRPGNLVGELGREAVQPLNKP